MRYSFGISAVAMMIAASVALNAQKTTQVHPGKGGSPHVRSEWAIDGANISIEYGRPSLKGRDVRGTGRMEAGKVWRLGADEATTLKTDKSLMFGSTMVAPGTYTLYLLPGQGETGWQLVINKQTGQWGTQYDEKQDLARVPMTVSKNSTPVEQLTLNLQDTPKGGELHVNWGDVSARVPFMVH